MARQFLVTVADSFREVDMPYLQRDLRAVFGIEKVERYDGHQWPSAPGVEKPKRRKAEAAS